MLDTNGNVDQQDNLFSVVGKLCVQIGHLTKELKQQSEYQRLIRSDATPVFAQTMDSGIVPAAGILVLNADGPDQGDFWYVRRITVGGLTPTTAAAGRVDIYVSAMDSRNKTTLSQFSITDWRDYSITLPAIATYGRGVLPMRFNEEIFAAISNGTVGQQYQLTCQFEKYQDAPVRGAQWVA